MRLNTIGKEAIDVDPRDIVQVTASGVTVIRTLQGAGQHTIQLTDDSAAVARAAMTRQAPRTELELFNLAATFGRRDTLPFRIPGTTAEHLVECVVMEPSDLAMFASAIGVPSVGAPREVFARQLNAGRRQSDRIEANRQAHLVPDFDEPADVPEAWREFARAIASIPDGAEPNIAGMRTQAQQLLGLVAV
jgi:hypothetical protein